MLKFWDKCVGLTGPLQLGHRSYGIEVKSAVNRGAAAVAGFYTFVFLRLGWTYGPARSFSRRTIYMSLNKASRRFGLVGTLLALSITTFLASDTAAQSATQYCECTDTYNTVAVRSVPVRRTAKKYRKAKRTTVARRSTTVVRPAYQQVVYVPVREVAYTPQYLEHVDDEDCDDDDIAYTSARRVVVTERVYPVAGSRYHVNGYNGNGVYKNGYNGNGVAYTTNGYSKARVYVGGRYSNLDVDADYFATERIAADYGYRDGFSDGHEVGLERESYNPYKEGDFKNGTNGYEGHFGSKYLYKQAYRDAYLKGYDAGFRSIAQQSTYRSKW